MYIYGNTYTLYPLRSKIEGLKMAKKRQKKVVEKVDGLGPKDIKRLRSAIRNVWRYSHPWKLVTQRCLLPDGFSKCEGCKKKCPKVFVDHIQNVGDVDSGNYILRMWTPSKNLQGLCKKCHDAKTKLERQANKKEKAPRKRKRLLSFDEMEC